MRLHDYTELELQLLDKLENGEDIGDTLESIQELTTDKLEGYAKIIKALEGNVAVIQLEEKRLLEKRKIQENGIKRMKESVFNHMQLTGKKKIDGQLFKFAIQKNPPSLEVVDELSIPKNYFTTPQPVLDKAAVKEELKLGHEIPGVQLVQGESLRIK